MGTLSDDTIAALKAQYPDTEMQAVSTALGWAVFRAPNGAEYKMFQDQIAKNHVSQAISMLARQCVVSPSRQEFDAWLEKKPGIATDCADTLTTLAGTTGQAETKKL